MRYVDNRPGASYRRGNSGEEGADTSVNIGNEGWFVFWFVRPFYVECVYSLACSFKACSNARMEGEEIRRGPVGANERGGADEGAWLAEKMGVVTFEDAVEDGAEEAGCSGSDSAICSLTGEVR